MRNPFTNPPRLAPTKRGPHSRSPSRSPTRQYARDNDPLLRDLSPSNTLRAFIAHPDELSSADADALVKSIQTSSHSERALGAKAAQICLDVRSWTRELESWEWPGSFDLPELPDRKMRLSTITYDSILSHNDATSESTEDEALEYWGSLPAQTVQMYEKRADEIGANLDQIDVEELKDYVLATHYRSSSRPASRQGNIAVGTMQAFKQLDDYTAVVTATILQALPYLSKLSQLLDVWTIRLLVLKAAPVYLRDLKRARTDLDHGWAAIAVSPTSATASHSASFSRDTMLQMKDVIEQQVGSLGARLDRFLDDLEGREETVPSAWIDNFEKLEAAYGTWVVQAERKVLENEWRQSAQDAVPGARASGQDQSVAREVHLTESQDPAIHHKEVSRLYPSTAEDPGGPSDDATSFLLDASDEADSPPDASHLDNEQQKSAFADFNFESQLLDDQSADVPLSREATPSRDPLPAINATRSVANKRAAFLHSIERSNSLKQSKSPVRPFEHASNAFTRLFKKDRSPENVRSRSLRSVNSKTSAGTKDDIPAASEEARSTSSASVTSSRLGSIDTRIAARATDTSSKLARGDAAAGEEVKDQGESEAVIDDTRLSQREIGEAVWSPNVKDTNLSPPKTRPETYQPTGLSSPYKNRSATPEFPENWPLASLDRTSPVLQSSQSKDSNEDYNETDSPTRPMSTDAFDMMFVQSFPPARSDTNPFSATDDSNVLSNSTSNRSASLPRTNSDSSRRSSRSYYLDNVYVGKPRARSIHSRIDSTRPVSTVAEELTPVSFDISPYSPEPEDAKTGYFPASTQSARPPSRKGRRPASTPPTMSGALKLQIPGLQSGKSAMPSNSRDESEGVSTVKRASVTSIGAIPASEVKIVDVSKTSKHDSAPQTPSSIDALNISPISYKGMISFPTPPTRSNVNSQAPSPIAESPLGHPNGLRSHPVNASSSLSPAVVTSNSAVAPLNATMKKRQKSSPSVAENQPTPRKAAPRPVGEDTFDRHVSEVLEKLPTGIRFKTRAGAETPLSRSSEPRGHLKPLLKAIRPTSKNTGMVLAPAEASPKKSSSSAEPEVKLYHLTQAGRDEPIKLFVRLVGEGERVMVRVGGGWADLADYLRQYAEHHGSRTVSEGAVEIQTVASSGNRRVSGPADSKARAPQSPTSTSRPSSDDSDKDWLNKPQPKFSMGDSDAESMMDEAPSTASLHKTPSKPGSLHSSDPKSPSGKNSRPSTADSAGRPLSRQSTAEIGLSGPSSARKTDLPEQQAKWVEGMLERAKKASAEKSREDRDRHFNELGKVGGTRRLAFRSGAADKSK